MFREKCAQQLRNVPISNNTVSRRFVDISEDLEEQLIEKLRIKRFSIQINEATDYSGIGYFVTYVHVLKTFFSTNL
jgi:hypothetical protein